MNIDFDDSEQQEQAPTQPDNSPQPSNPALSPVATEIIDTEPVKVSSKEEKELKVPQIIKTNYNLQHYNPDIMQAIILDIATTNDSIDDIIAKHGQKKTTVYLWRSISVQLMNAWRAAKRHRTHVIADTYESEVAILDAQVENDEDYKRTSNRIRRFDRVWSHNEWFLSRHNRQDYGDKVETDVHMDISPAKARDDAYNAHQGDIPPEDAEYEVINVPNTLNKSVDNGQSQ